MGKPTHHFTPHLSRIVMPKTKITKKDTLDKFYTKPEIAKSCIDIFI